MRCWPSSLETEVKSFFGVERLNMDVSECFNCCKQASRLKWKFLATPSYVNRTRPVGAVISLPSGLKIWQSFKWSFMAATLTLKTSMPD